MIAVGTTLRQKIKKFMQIALIVLEDIPMFIYFFQRPIKPDSWNDVLNTTRLPPACWQGKINAIYIKAHMPEFDINDQSEDCLYLNIFVPKVYSLMLVRANCKIETNVLSIFIL